MVDERRETIPAGGTDYISPRKNADVSLQEISPILATISPHVSGVLRTEQWTHVLALVVSVVAFTALCGLLVRYYYNAEDEVDSSGSGLSTDFGRNYTPTSKTLLGSTGELFSTSNHR